MNNKKLSKQRTENSTNIKYIGDYQIIKKIGEGSYAKIYKVKKDDSDTLYVLKNIPVSEEDYNSMNEILNESSILSNCNNTYIIKYYNSFIYNGTFNIITEFCPYGDLFGYIKFYKDRGSRIEEKIIWIIFIQLSLGLCYLHNKKILHRDIKTKNIFIKNNLTVKIGDFGIAKILSSTSSYAHTFIGTPYYISPELCKDQPYNDKSDVWALGCVLYELATLNHPFEGGTQVEIYEKIIKEKYKAINSEYSLDLKKMIDILLEKDEFKRPKIKEILNMKIVIDRANKYKIELKIEDNKEPEDSMRDKSKKKNNNNNNDVKVIKEKDSSDKKCKKLKLENEIKNNKYKINLLKIQNQQIKSNKSKTKEQKNQNQSKKTNDSENSSISINHPHQIQNPSTQNYIKQIKESVNNSYKNKLNSPNKDTKMYKNKTKQNIITRQQQTKIGKIEKEYEYDNYNSNSNILVNNVNNIIANNSNSKIEQTNNNNNLHGNLGKNSYYYYKKEAILKKQQQQKKLSNNKKSGYISPINDNKNKNNNKNNLIDEKNTNNLIAKSPLSKKNIEFTLERIPLQKLNNSFTIDQSKEHVKIYIDSNDTLNKKTESEVLDENLKLQSLKNDIFKEKENKENEMKNISLRVYQNVLDMYKEIEKKNEDISSLTDNIQKYLKKNLIVEGDNNSTLFYKKFKKAFLNFIFYEIELKNIEDQIEKRKMKGKWEIKQNSESEVVNINEEGNNNEEDE